MAFITCLPTSSYSQQFEARTIAGASYYLGDLAPFRHNLSSSEGKFAGGVSLGWKFDEVFTLSARYIYGTLTGDDKNSNDYVRRKRNLNFTSPLHEFGITLDVYVTTVAPAIKKFGLDFYITTGYNLFYYNPQTEFQGETISLQPLGTEGQGVAAFGNNRKYKLIQPSFAIGVGWDFKISENVKLGFEIAPRLTWTDYIDDVSGTYIGTNDQILEQGELTAALANRKGEYVFGIASSEIVEVETGQQRGDRNDNDWYLMTLSYISYRFGGPVAAIKKANKLKEIKKY